MLRAGQRERGFERIREKRLLLAIVAAAATGPSRYLIRSGGMYRPVSLSLSSSSIFSQPAHFVLSSFLMTFPPPSHLFADPHFLDLKKKSLLSASVGSMPPAFRYADGGTRKS